MALTAITSWPAFSATQPLLFPSSQRPACMGVRGHCTPTREPSNTNFRWWVRLLISTVNTCTSSASRIGQSLKTMLENPKRARRTHVIHKIIKPYRADCPAECPSQQASPEVNSLGLQEHGNTSLMTAVRLAVTFAFTSAFSAVRLSKPMPRNKSSACFPPPSAPSPIPAALPCATPNARRLGDADSEGLLLAFNNPIPAPASGRRGAPRAETSTEKP